MNAVLGDLAIKRAVFFWIFSFCIVVLSGILVIDIHTIRIDILVHDLKRSLAPLLSCIIILITTHYVINDRRLPIAHLLFFAISLTSLFGLTKTMTGSHAESSNVYLYGLSFYTASIAYLKATGKIGRSTLINVSNPLLIITGPIAIYVKDIKYKKLSKRIRYFLPFIILGVFLHQSIATPLTSTFGLINNTDVASTVVFALIFELFVYANFCGLSLIVFGVAGILGFSIPLNFRQPFSSTNIIDFWKGWHTSLSSVLKVLFYKPVRKKYGSSAALFSVYIASAMWHGVTLNFLFWGTFHSLVFIISLWFLRRRMRLVPLIMLPVAIIIGRMLFADSDTVRLLMKLKFEFVDYGFMDVLSNSHFTVKLALVMAALFVSFEFLLQKTDYFRQRTYKLYRTPIMQLLLLFIIAITINNGTGVAYAVYGQR